MEFCFGALSDSLEIQANSQGYTLGEHKEFQEIADSLLLCYENKIITDKEYNKALERLHKKIIKKVKKI